MGQRRIVTLFAFIALIALAAGCAAQKTDAVASRTVVSDASRSTFPHELVGTWNGSFRPVGGADGGGGNGMAGGMTVGVKEGGADTVISARRGAGGGAGECRGGRGACGW